MKNSSKDHWNRYFVFLYDMFNFTFCNLSVNYIIKCLGGSIVKHIPQVTTYIDFHTHIPIVNWYFRIISLSKMKNGIKGIEAYSFSSYRQLSLARRPATGALFPCCFSAFVQPRDKKGISYSFVRDRNSLHYRYFQWKPHQRESSLWRLAGGPGSRWDPFQHVIRSRHSFGCYTKCNSCHYQTIGHRQ